MIDAIKGASVATMGIFGYPITITNVTPGTLNADGTGNPGTTSTTSVMGRIQHMTKDERNNSLVSNEFVKIRLVGCDVDLCASTFFEPTCGPFAGISFQASINKTNNESYKQTGSNGMITIYAKAVC